MEVELVKCPACGGNIDIKNIGEFLTCQYCRRTIHIRRRNVNTDGSTTFTDPATGMVLGTVRVPFGFKVNGLLMPNISSYTYPLGVSAAAFNDQGVVLSYFIGEAYNDKSRCPAMDSIYAQGLDQISKTHYRNFNDIRTYLDGYAKMYAENSKATQIRFVEERPMPLYEPFDQNQVATVYKQRIDLERQRSGTYDPRMVRDEGLYVQGLCRVYDMECQNLQVRFAITTVIEACRYHLVAFDQGGMYGGGMMGGLFNMFTRPAAPPTPNVKPGAFNDMPINSVIEWQSEGVFIMQSLIPNFDEAFRTAYTDFCSTLKLDAGIREKSYNMQTQILQNIANHTQNQINRMNREFQSWQQINAAQQAAFDRANQAWWDRTNAHDAAFRASSQSEFNSRSGADRFAEAMRGVNTYVREDGTETEVSVAYDRAYSNGLGDTLGSNSAFEPGGDWTEMTRLN